MSGFHKHGIYHDDGTPWGSYVHVWQLEKNQVVFHYNEVIMGLMVSQITSLTIVYSAVYSGIDKRKQSSASLAFVRGIHRWPVNSLHKGPVMQKMFPFHNVIMLLQPALPSKLVLACVQDFFAFTMCWFETILSSPCAQQRKLKVNTHEPNVNWNDTQIKHSQTHHVHNINTKVKFVLKHNVSSTSKTHSESVTLHKHQFAG